jgi:hypothetical protein
MPFFLLALRLHAAKGTQVRATSGTILEVPIAE